MIKKYNQLRVSSCPEVLLAKVVRNPIGLYVTVSLNSLLFEFGILIFTSADIILSGTIPPYDPTILKLERSDGFCTK